MRRVGSPVGCLSRADSLGLISMMAPEKVQVRKPDCVFCDSPVSVEASSDMRAAFESCALTRPMTRAGLRGLSRKSAAPAVRACTSQLTSLSAEMRMTGVSAVRGSCFRRRHRSMPDIAPMVMSEMTREGIQLLVISRACSPDSAKRMWPMPSSRLHNSRTASGASSTTSMRAPSRRVSGGSEERSSSCRMLSAAGKSSASKRCQNATFTSPV